MNTINLDSVSILDVSAKYNNNISIRIEYELSNNKDKTSTSFIKLNKELKRVYFPDELSILEEDIQNLNEILQFKKQQKQGVLSKKMFTI